MYSGVPLTLWSLVSSTAPLSFVSFTRPKSRILAKSTSPPRTVMIDIRRLQVAVYQADGMGLGQSGTDLAEEVNDPSGGQRAVLLHEVLQAHPRQVFHHIIKGPIVGVAVVVDLDRVGMRKPRGRLDLALESGQRDRVGSRFGLDQLERAGPLEATGARPSRLRPSPRLPASRAVDTGRTFWPRADPIADHSRRTCHKSPGPPRS